MSEVLDGFLDTFPGVSAPVIATFKVGLIGFGILGVPGGYSLLFVTG